MIEGEKRIFTRLFFTLVSYFFLLSDRGANGRRRLNWLKKLTKRAHELGFLTVAMDKKQYREAVRLEIITQRDLFSV